MDTLEAMRVFMAVAAQASFTAGAKQIGITTNLASKQVARLEERLGTQLFNRTTRSVTLTETGKAYLQRCGPLLDQFDDMEDAVRRSHGELAGAIRLTAPTGFGSRELAAALGPFLRAHPKVEIDMRLSDQHVALVEDGIDLAVRFGALKDSTLVARKLMDMPLVVHASPAYLSAHGIPADPGDLTDHVCLLQTTLPDPVAWSFEHDGRTVSVPVHGPFRANSPRAIVHMALGGMGIGRTPRYPAAPYLESGQLVSLFEAQGVAPITLYAVYPSSRHLTARIRALVDHLADWFGR